jgi:hypothetical protein
MTGRTEPTFQPAATSPLFGRRLRGLFGDVVVGLDAEMITLLERLLDVPGVTDAARSGAAHPSERAIR